MSDIQQIAQQARSVAKHNGDTTDLSNDIIFNDGKIYIRSFLNSAELWVSVYTPHNGEWQEVLEIDADGGVMTWRSFARIRDTNVAWVDHLEKLAAEVPQQPATATLMDWHMTQWAIASYVAQVELWVAVDYAIVAMMTALEDCSHFITQLIQESDTSLQPVVIQDENGEDVAEVFETETAALLLEIQTALAFGRGEIMINADGEILVDVTEQGVEPCTTS